MDNKNQGKQVLYTTQTIAKLFNMTDRNVRYLVENGIIDRVAYNKFDLASTIQKYVKYLQDKAFGKAIDDSDYEKEKMLHERAKRERAEIKVQLLKNELFNAREIDLLITAMIMNTKTKLLILPTKLAPVLTSTTEANVIKDLIDKEIRICLDELSKYNFSDIRKMEDIDIGDDDDDDYAEEENQNHEQS